MYKMRITFIFLMNLCLACRGLGPCEPPPRWHGRTVEVTMGKEIEIRSRVFYDANLPGMRVVNQVELDAKTDFFDTLYLFNQSIKYEFNFRTKICNATKISNIPPKFGIPRLTKFVSAQQLGVSGMPFESLTVFNYASEPWGARSFGTVTTPDCLPVVYGLVSNTTGTVWNFYDISIGFSGNTPFKPPAGCQNSTVD